MIARQCGHDWRVAAALVELLQNAFEHGCFRFGGAEKQRLIAAGQWQQALCEATVRHRALGQPCPVRVLVEDGAHGLRLTVEDDGPGFVIPNSAAPDGAGTRACSGRGLRLAVTLSGAQLLLSEGGRRVSLQFGQRSQAFPDVG